MLYEGATLKDIYGDYDELNDSVKLLANDLAAELDYVVTNGIKTYVVSISELDTPAYTCEERSVKMKRLFGIRLSNASHARALLVRLVFVREQQSKAATLAELRELFEQMAD